MYFEVFGNGKITLLFLHGWGGSSLSFLGLASCFANEYKVVLLDFKGFGKSSLPDSNYSVSNYSQDVVDLINKLKLNNICIISHSFGGRIAIKLSRMLKILGIVFIDSAGIKPKKSFKYYYLVWKYHRCKRAVLSGKKDSTALNKYGSSDYKGLNNVMRQVFVNVVNEDLSLELKNIKLPCLILWGKNDTDTPLYMAKLFKKYITDSKLEILYDCGHYCYLQKPQLCYNLIKQFIVEKIEL